MNNSFIQISDSHIDDKKNVWGTDSQKNLYSIVKSIASKNYNALIISGDLAHNGTASSYSLFKKIIKPINSNLSILPGNHDDKLNLSSAFSDNYLKKLAIADWEIISIDSVQDNKTSGFIKKMSLNYLLSIFYLQLKNLLCYAFITHQFLWKVIGMIKNP